MINGLQEAFGEKVLHGLLEQLGWLRLKVFDNLFIVLHEGAQVRIGVHVVLSIAKVHIKLVGLQGGGGGGGQRQGLGGGGESGVEEGRRQGKRRKAENMNTN